jgi:hypothetical protein
MLNQLQIQRRLASLRSWPDRVSQAWAYFGQFGNDMFDDPACEETTCTHEVCAALT